jgi:P pilus assembly chaperone PapD
MLWTQDGSGKDVYTPTDEINYFPRLATVEAQNSRVFRLGIKGEVPAVEKAYRFFIEEVPKAQTDATKSQITVSVRFGAPVFLHPAKTAMGGEVTSLAIKGDTLEVGIHNTGNMHFMIEQAVAQLGAGEPVSDHGWYLLPGASRVQTLKLPVGTCQKIDPKSVSVKIVTESPDFSFQSGGVNVTRDCNAKAP